MARGAAKQKQRAAPSKPTTRRQAAARRRTPAEEQMFFMRLRRGTKPIFIFLALVFAASFVFLGVGSGSSGIGDLLQGNFHFGGSSGPSIGSAQGKIKKNPKDAAAYLELAKAYEAKGRTDDAIGALTTYVVLQPRASSALQELAGLYLTKAEAYRQQVQIAQLDAQNAGLGSLFGPATTPKLSQAVGQDAITQALSTKAQTELTNVYTKMQSAFGNAAAAYKSLAKTSPNDPNVQLQLAQAAESASDTPTAIAAYKKFLKLAPDDPSAGPIRQRVKQLQSSSTLSTPTSG
jgi:cytochrome c-type biogenesis protein CcmH/NrfG